jgi:hypothetical protein
MDDLVVRDRYRAPHRQGGDQQVGGAFAVELGLAEEEVGFHADSVAREVLDELLATFGPVRVAGLQRGAEDVQKRGFPCC